MKKLVQVQEVAGEGLEGLLGDYVDVWCANFIYSGKLVGVNKTCILLEDASIVYETGALDAKGFKDAQKLPVSRYIRLGAIESFAKRAF